MVVRAGQYVSVEGRVYHPYLAGWREDRPPSLPPQNAPVPPPVPPLPPELGRSESVSSRSGSGPQSSPPPRPPKADERHAQPPPHQANGAPPVPPHPRLQSPDVQRANGPVSLLPEHQRYQSQRVDHLRQEGGPVAGGQNQKLTNHIPYQQPGSPVSPMTPISNQRFPQHASHMPFHAPPSHDPQHSQPPPPPVQGSSQIIWQQQPGHLQSQQLLYQPAAQQAPPKPKPQEDLLTSPFENTLPASTVDVEPPPIPPNPHKDALLQALSQTLTQQVQSAHASNMSAIPPLRAQQVALNETLSKINQEISQLSDLEGLLDSNEKILRQAMLDADQVLEDAKKKDVPAVEEVLVAPTVVAGQLYECVIEERVLEECRTVVGKALDKGRVGGDVWAKVQTLPKIIGSSTQLTFNSKLEV
ncbi:MAG: hypothetical protein Q9179_004811 [Wetmoreana sp. 5 TL-2023]